MSDEKKMLRVLIVDDEPAVAGFLLELFESRGYKVHMETDSRKALEHFKQAPDDYDLVITDQTMPGLSGADMAKAMLNERPDLPIVLCTGYSEHIDEHSARELGIRKFMAKPIDPISLVAIADEMRA